ncbi:MAG: hypothetical protein FWG51_00365, partial [Firmicutes bacterium]|nr:hypothetical protein [Bacillota bacterium]
SCYSTSSVGSVGSRTGGLVGYPTGSYTIISDCAALNFEVSGRIYGYTFNGQLHNNVAFKGTLNGDSVAIWPDKGYDQKDGADITAEEIIADGTLGGRFLSENGWIIENGKLPSLFGETVDMPQYILDAVKSDGATVIAPTLDTKTTSSITINSVTAPGNGQEVEYAINTTDIAPESGWQMGLTFSGLDADTTYYVFARSKENDYFNAGTAVSVQITTDAITNPNYTIIVQNDGNGTASANVLSASEGTEIILTATPNSGYYFKEWQIAEGTVITTGNRFIMPSSDVTIMVVFVQIYSILDGANGSWANSSADGYQIVLEADVNDFMSLKINGVTLIQDVDYTVASGSVIITLNSEYLKTLSNGEHEVEIEFENGIAITALTITDDDGLSLWVTVSIIAGAVVLLGTVIFVVIIKRKKTA